MASSKMMYHRVSEKKSRHKFTKLRLFYEEPVATAFLHVRKLVLISIWLVHVTISYRFFYGILKMKTKRKIIFEI